MNIYYNFCSGWEWNPTVKTLDGTRQTNGFFKTGLNIQMDVPPAGESYTAYVTIDNTYTIAFTNFKEAEPISDYPTGTWVLDFWTKEVWYSGTVMSQWVQFPFLNTPTEFMLTGNWNPTVKTSNGTRSSSGTVHYWTNIQVDIPEESGQEHVVEFEVADRQWVFRVIRK